MMEIPVVPVNYYVGGIQCQVVSKYFAVLNFCFLRLNWGGGEGGAGAVPGVGGEEAGPLHWLLPDPPAPSQSERSLG